jgi:hypothetical protein
MPARLCKTAFGSVNAHALERLRESFETQRLLAAVDQVDHVAELVNDSGLRRDLLRLHGMAHTILMVHRRPRPARRRSGNWPVPW